MITIAADPLKRITEGPEGNNTIWHQTSLLRVLLQIRRESVLIRPAMLSFRLPNGHHIVLAFPLTSFIGGGVGLEFGGWVDGNAHCVGDVHVVPG